MALIITERNEADRFKEAMRKIEDGYKEIEHLSDKMRIQYGERGTRADRDGDGRYNERYDDYPKGYGERYGERDGYGYGHREGGWDERRDSMGRYR